MKKSFFFINAFIFIFFSVTTLNCNRDIIKIYGTVKDFETGDPVAGALVTMDDEFFTTDENGNYSIDSTGDFDDKVLNIQKSGYGFYSKPLSDNTSEEVKLDALLIPADITVIIDPSAGAHTVETFDGAKVEFPDLSGEGISENLKVSLTHYNVSSDELGSTPGNFLVIDGGETSNIVSQGMLDVNITGEDTGNTYDFNGAGVVFTIIIPITGDPATAPATIDMWWYDESRGLWVKDGTATKNGDVYEGSVTHFTTWNMDYKTPDRIRIHGTIVDPDDPETYDIRLESPGFSRTNSINDKDLNIINMIRGIRIELTIVKRSTGFENIIVFNSIPNTTDPDTGEEYLELGNLLSDDYLPFVSGLRIFQEGSGVRLTWTNPDHGDYTGLQIIYDGNTVTSSGDEEEVISGLTPGTTYEFVITALYTGSRESVSVTRTITIGSYATLTLGIDDYLTGLDLIDYDSINDWITLYYRYGDNTSFIEYTDPVLLPGQSSVTCRAVSATEYVEYGDYSYYLYLEYNVRWRKEEGDFFGVYDSLTLDYTYELDDDDGFGNGDGADELEIFFYYGEC
jgi:hypothetical protein